MKRAFAIAGIVLLLPLCIWHIAVPEATIRGFLDAGLEGSGLSADIDDIRKGLFWSFSAGRVNLRGTGGEAPGRALVVSVEDVSAGPDWGTVLRLSPVADLQGKLGSGTLTGRVALTGGRTLTVSGRGVNMRDLPSLQQYGLNGDGTLMWDFTSVGDTGSLVFSVSEARLADTAIGGAPMPLHLFHAIRGAVQINAGKTQISSVTLEGRGVHARISGSVHGGAIDLKLEVMHDSSYKPEPFTEALLRPYRVSPGYYVIPVKQTLR